MAEKSKGFAAIPTPGEVGDILCSDETSAEDASNLEPALSSESTRFNEDDTLHPNSFEVIKEGILLQSVNIYVIIILTESNNQSTPYPSYLNIDPWERWTGTSYPKTLCSRVKHRIESSRIYLYT